MSKDKKIVEQSKTPVPANEGTIMAAVTAEAITAEAEAKIKAGEERSKAFDNLTAQEAAVNLMGTTLKTMREAGVPDAALTAMTAGLQAAIDNRDKANLVCRPYRLADFMSSADTPALVSRLHTLFAQTDCEALTFYRQPDNGIGWKLVERIVKASPAENKSNGNGRLVTAEELAKVGGNGKRKATPTGNSRWLAILPNGDEITSPSASALMGQVEDWKHGDDKGRSPNGWDILKIDSDARQKINGGAAFKADYKTDKGTVEIWANKPAN